MNINKVHCLFEQSGTFKKEFIKLGFDSYDYDINNDFNETDFIIDLFKEINNCYENKSSIFDSFENDDLIFAFFPCTRFENQIYMHFQGTAYNLKSWSIEEKLLYDIRLHDELNFLYKMITRLVLICIRKNFKLIIENPYSKEHYLTRYWSLRSTIIDYDRTKFGDYYKKPTQYWFVNCSPILDNFTFEISDNNYKTGIIYESSKVKRSLFSSDYANRFIREYILNL